MFDQPMRAPVPPPQAGQPGANPFQMKFQQVVQGATEVIQTMMRMPNVNQDLVKQAASKFSEGMIMLGQAVQGGQGGSPEGAAGGGMVGGGAPPAGGTPPTPGAGA